MKKFLSLVLALVMTMSLVTVSAGAKDFTDAEDITYVEAVDVMTAIKVVDGDTAGNFNPTNGLTRGAAAKIICNLILGPTTAAELNADTNPYPDVDKDSVFAGYIAYCAKEGIVGGYADGTFKPAAPLTGYAFMKMLLGALGYDATKEGYVGANWSINVAKQAIGIGLNKGLVEDFNGSDYVTREEAMLYAFNTLKATMVQYVNDSKVTVGDVTIETNSKASYVDAIPGRNYNGATAGSESEKTLQFAEKYFSNLTVAGATDALMRVCDRWRVKSDIIGTYYVEADAVAVVADTGKTIGDIITGTSYMNYSANDIALAAVGAPNCYVYFNGDQVMGNQAAVLALVLNKGDVVYAYENTTGDVEKIVIARYEYAEIDTVVTKLSTSETDAGAAYRVKLLDIDENSIGTFYDDHDVAARKLNGFDADTYVADASLAVALSVAGAVVDSYVIEPVVGVPTTARENNTGSGFIAFGDAKYNYTGAYNDLGTVAGNLDFDNEYAVYTTAEGYVIAIMGVAAANLDDIYYVTGAFTKTSAYGEAGVTYWVQRVSMDGLVDAVQVEKGALQMIDGTEDFDGATFGAITSDVTSGTAYAGLYTFHDKSVPAASVTDGIDADSTGASAAQKAGNGVLTIVPFADDATITRDYAQDVDAITGTAVTGTVIKADASKVVVNGGQTYYLNETTKFVSVEKAASGYLLETKAAVGGMKVTITASQAVPVYVIYDAEDGKTAKAVIYADAANVVASSTTADVIYIGSEPSVKNSNDTYTGTVWFMKDNHDESITMKTHYTNGFYTYKVVDGVYELEGLANMTLAADYDDETGALANATVSSIYQSSKISFRKANFVDANFKGVTIIDNRTDAVKAGDAYKVEINSVADLKDAVATGVMVNVDVYFADGVTFIAVDSLSDTAAEAATGAQDLTIDGTTVTVNTPVTASTVGAVGGKTWAQWNFPVGDTMLAVIKVVAPDAATTVDIYNETTGSASHTALTVSDVADGGSGTAAAPYWFYYAHGVTGAGVDEVVTFTFKDGSGNVVHEVSYTFCF